MEIIIKDCQDLYKCGVYCIKNKVNGRCYIGSTIMSIKKRTDHHISLLRSNSHKNKHLQNAYNLYGEESFQIFILENTDKSNTLNREQFYLDNTLNTYNINPLASGTPNLPEEVQLKKSETMKAKFRNGEADFGFKKGHVPWNKGQLGIDCSYLKGVKKTKSDKVLEKLKNQSENFRKSLPDIYIYDNFYNFLARFRSAKDIEEFSLTEKNNLPIKGRFSVERMNIPIKFLSSISINKSCKTGNSYKGLFFSTRPLHEEIHVEKLGKNGELCDENTVLSSTITKGVETV